MGNFFKKLWMGCGYLEGYGEHPGTGMVLTLVAGTTLAVGVHSGLRGAVLGFVSSSVIYGACFLCGAYNRADGYLRAHPHEGVTKEKTT